MKTSKFAILAALTLPLLILCGCSTVSVTTDHDPSAPFASYRSYALEPPAKVPPLAPSEDSALRSTLRNELAARGIREVAANEKPDLAVVPHISLQQRYSVQQYTQWGYAPGMWPYWGGFYGGWVGMPVTTINTYTEGTLVLDFVDTSKQSLVFRGTGRATVSNNNERNASRIREAVTKIVDRFPATSGSPQK
jgi:hypothetical protein